MSSLEGALEALVTGRPILLYDADGREEETDMVIAAQHATPEIVRLFRQDAGGLVCTTVAPEDHQRLGLPWLCDIQAAAATNHPVLGALEPDDIRYDAHKPAFGITINHRDTFTGITDADRSKTMLELAAFFEATRDDDPADAVKAFGKEFRSPGHCILLNVHPYGLAARQGHTELSDALMRMAGLQPTATICEMLDASGNAKSRKEAEAYAALHDLPFLAGDQVLDAWQQTPVQA